MLPLERASKLRQEADSVLKLIHLAEIVQPYVPTSSPPFYLSGSCYLDVMVYPDIDLYLSTVNLEDLFVIGLQIVGCEQVTQVVFERSDDQVHLPQGLYLKPRVNYGDWGRPWKIDMWSLTENVIADRMDELNHFKAHLTPALRERIISYKLSILTSQKRTPMYSGYYIYKAFIDEGLVDDKDITNYLISNGIQVDALG